MKESFFQNGWRPFIGWICCAALAYNFLLHPFLYWMCVLFSPQNVANIRPAPELDLEQLATLVGTILAVGGLRTYEKTRSPGRYSHLNHRDDVDGGPSYGG